MAETPEQRMWRLGRLPKQLIVAHIRNWEKENHYDSVTAAGILGIDAKYCEKDTKTIHFELADRILTKMDKVDMWYRDAELNRHYMNITFTQYKEPHRRGTSCIRAGCKTLVEKKGMACCDECYREYRRIDNQHKQNYRMKRKQREKAAES